MLSKKPQKYCKFYGPAKQKERGTASLEYFNIAVMTTNIARKFMYNPEMHTKRKTRQKYVKAKQKTSSGT